MKGWFIDKGHDLFLNMLQVKRAREIGFFSNSFIIIDLEEIKEVIES
jgi:hypothetical protein